MHKYFFECGSKIRAIRYEGLGVVSFESFRAGFLFFLCARSVFIVFISLSIETMNEELANSLLQVSSAVLMVVGGLLTFLLLLASQAISFCIICPSGGS